jgi:hypothetical protein
MDIRTVLKQGIITGPFFSLDLVDELRTDEFIPSLDPRQETEQEKTLREIQEKTQRDIEIKILKSHGYDEDYFEFYYQPYTGKWTHQWKIGQILDAVQAEIVADEELGQLLKKVEVLNLSGAAIRDSDFSTVEKLVDSFPNLKVLLMRGVHPWYSTSLADLRRLINRLEFLDVSYTVFSSPERADIFEEGGLTDDELSKYIFSDADHFLPSRYLPWTAMQTGREELVRETHHRYFSKYYRNFQRYYSEIMEPLSSAYVNNFFPKSKE